MKNPIPAAWLLAASLAASSAASANTLALLDTIGDGDWGEAYLLTLPASTGVQLRKCFSTPDGDPHRITSITLLLLESDLFEPLTTPDGLKLALKADSDLPLADPTTEFVLESTAVRSYDPVPPYVGTFYARYVPRVEKVLRGGQDYCLTLWRSTSAFSNWTITAGYVTGGGGRRSFPVESDVGYTMEGDLERYDTGLQSGGTFDNRHLGLRIDGQAPLLLDPVRTSHARIGNAVRITHEFDYAGPDPANWILFRCQAHSRAGKAYRDPRVCHDPVPENGRAYPGSARSISIDEHPPSGVHAHRIESSDGFVRSPTLYYDVGLGRNVAGGQPKPPRYEGAVTFKGALAPARGGATHSGAALVLNFTFSAEPSRRLDAREVGGIVDISCGMTRRVDRRSNRQWQIMILPCRQDIDVMMAPTRHITDADGNWFLGSNLLKLTYD